jgi:hypothetical protein
VTQFNKSRDDHFHNDGQPKRILALDGGGLRGILTLGILEQIEELLRARYGGDPDFRLCDYFDLIAGTSTGAIIAAALAQGDSVRTVVDTYNELGKKVFQQSLLRQGLFRAKYDQNRLSSELKAFYKPDTTLGSERLKTGLLVVTKRLDTGSPWPLGNNPRGKYFTALSEGVIGNGDYPLWQVVRASTAAPAFFDPETLTIAEQEGRATVEGDFVDGGVSPFNNPSVQALMYATIGGYRVGWPMGADRLMLVSVGTGAADPDVKRASVSALQAVNALLSLMNDCASLQETLMQWMSSSPSAQPIDRELGNLAEDNLGASPLVGYTRYNVELSPAEVQRLQPELTDPDEIAKLSAMDSPDNMPVLYDLGRAVGKRDVGEADFPAHFDVGAS